MDWTDDAPVSPMGGAWRPMIDITVPYADASRDHVLHSRWRRQAGDLLPAPPLTLPRRAEGAFRVRIRAQRLLDLPVEDQYSDAVAGATGGPGGHLENQIVTHITFTGRTRFATRGRQAVAAAGTVCVRRNDEPWDFEVARDTRAIAVGLPAGAIRFPGDIRAVTAPQTAPAARLLLAQLRLFAGLSEELGPAGATAARNAIVELFRGLVNDQVVDDREVSPALFEAARGYIEDRLLDDPDLDPGSIADALHVSVRTLYRVFAEQAPGPVMAYVRERRLDRARAELLSTRLTVSEVAARWHFADGSHFVKAYRKRFGEVPTARRKP
ncbi:transcriptional regulator [Virgisporangium aliadipatigenens]|uniref:Transcriptional regulator n=1 Tax=Virgisporangium aliadipatigenens TaxID=741659 RepID=A0A8J3YJH8_9ACTN|nr:helix-turn-helix transcriptional regulator [Virgisporangium aliadipatigenens]GIJ45170.1 transcriptional regulator [Virgisporangium aliadipatigenens]